MSKDKETEVKDKEAKDRDNKLAFLGTLRYQLQEQATKELANGKLTSPAKLDDVCGRLIPALRKNVITNLMLKKLDVDDVELRNVVKNALLDAKLEVV